MLHKLLSPSPLWQFRNIREVTDWTEIFQRKVQTRLLERWQHKRLSFQASASESTGVKREVDQLCDNWRVGSSWQDLPAALLINKRTCSWERILKRVNCSSRHVMSVAAIDGVDMILEDNCLPNSLDLDRACQDPCKQKSHQYKQPL